MSYFILRTKEFANGVTAGERTLYVIKKKDIPSDQRPNVVNLKCSSIQRVSSISDLVVYLSSNTCDSHHVVQPYIIKRISWQDAIAMFGIETDTDTTESD